MSCEPTALSSLYGGSVARKRKSRGELDGESTALAGCIGGLPRLQEVHTCPWILDFARAAFGGPIAHDPCAASDPSCWFATERNTTLPAEALDMQARLQATDDKAERKLLKKALKPFYNALPDALLDCAFLNPQFDHLAKWMQLVFEQGQTGRRSILLCPVRPHRKWWTRYAQGANGVWLAPFPFVGQKQAFPAPVCLLARNCDLPPMGKRETGRFRL
jgi:hypothetical protein